MWPDCLTSSLPFYSCTPGAHGKSNQDNHLIKHVTGPENGPLSGLTAPPTGPLVDPDPPDAAVMKCRETQWCGAPDADTIAHLRQLRARLSGLPKAMAMLIQYQRRIAAQAWQRRLETSDVDPGVVIEQVYDFYDPATRKIRLRKIQATSIHRRAPKARGRLRSDSKGSTAEPPTPRSRTSSKNSSAASSEGGRAPDLLASMDLQHGRLNRNTGAEVAARRQLRGLSTTLGLDVIVAWGVVVAKVLHTRVLSFTDMENKTMVKRRLLLKDDAAKPQRVMQSVCSRAQMVIKQAKMLARRVANEPIDLLDSEWHPEGLLTDLFSCEFEDTLLILAHAAFKVISRQPPLAKACVPCKIFGDTHGQFRDVLMLFNAFGWPQEKSDISFVFNGDFVDRGLHQVELVGLLLSLKLALPDKVWLVRGNHEDKYMNEKYGFTDACLAIGKFGRRFLDLMHKVFEQLPIACIVEDRILVLHGGLGDARWSISDLMRIQRPLGLDELHMSCNSWISSILWSDPIEDDSIDNEAAVFGVHPSPRSQMARNFGWNITKTFCARNGISLIVRSHQSKRDSPGFDVMHDNLLVRVFSARDYEGHGNDGAVLFVKSDPMASAERLLVVRPQVLRSTTKARKEAVRHCRDEIGSNWKSDGSDVSDRSEGEIPMSSRSQRNEAPRSSSAQPQSRASTHEDINVNSSIVRASSDSDTKKASYLQKQSAKHKERIDGAAREGGADSQRASDPKSRPSTAAADKTNSDAQKAREQVQNRASDLVVETKSDTVVRPGSARVRRHSDTPEPPRQSGPAMSSLMAASAAVH